MVTSCSVILSSPSRPVVVERCFSTCRGDPGGCTTVAVSHFFLTTRRSVAIPLLLCFVGVSMATSGLFGVAVMLIFAVIGYLLSSFGYSLVILIIAFFLGPRFEISIAQSLALMNGDLWRIYQYPVAVALLVMSVFRSPGFSQRGRLGKTMHWSRRVSVFASHLRMQNDKRRLLRCRPFRARGIIGRY